VFLDSMNKATDYRCGKARDMIWTHETTACCQMGLQCGKAELRAQRGGLLEGKGSPQRANSG
jgi:hypothetical protein